MCSLLGTLGSDWIQKWVEQANACLILSWKFEGIRDYSIQQTDFKRNLESKAAFFFLFFWGWSDEMEKLPPLDCLITIEWSVLFLLLWILLACRARCLLCITICCGHDDRTHWFVVESCQCVFHLGDRIYLPLFMVAWIFQQPLVAVGLTASCCSSSQKTLCLIMSLFVCIIIRFSFLILLHFISMHCFVKL